MVPDVPHKVIQYDLICNVVWCYGYCLQASLLFLFCLKAYSLFFGMATMRNAQTKIAIVYMREQTFGTRDDMIPIWYDMYAMEGVDH